MVEETVIIEEANMTVTRKRFVHVKRDARIKGKLSLIPETINNQRLNYLSNLEQACLQLCSRPHKSTKAPIDHIQSLTPSHDLDREKKLQEELDELLLSPYSFFSLFRGIRQGNPMSPTLFTICFHLLSRLIMARSRKDESMVSRLVGKALP
ncbi:hypothetical protein M9H77_06401 [Catharanthus roseus]|uniref:Uncharacterized protein n=1 Tax=Catharanthus roseus TaxID=4058 RepID=A0ACC0BRZ8_CATRO|nr:hypothetical protein M9H77_06401 [Catharanthus roseus]